MWGGGWRVGPDRASWGNAYQWGQGLFLRVLSMDVSADVCAIGMRVEIMAQQPHNRITRQKTLPSPAEDPARPELPTAQRSAASGLARSPPSFRFHEAPALDCGQLREAHLFILFLLRCCAHAHRSWP